jgi:hypothetical protein
MLYSNLSRSFCDDRPDSPIAQALPDFASLREGAQRTFLKLPRSLPGIDAVLDPQRDGHGTNATDLATQVRYDPTVLPHLYVFHGQGG